MKDFESSDDKDKTKRSLTPLGDPAAMEGMMGGMMKQAVMFIPQASFVCGVSSFEWRC